MNKGFPGHVARAACRERGQCPGVQRTMQRRNMASVTHGHKVQRNSDKAMGNKVGKEEVCPELGDRV